MSRNDSVVAICLNHGKAGQAVKKLRQSGFGIQKLSVVANGAKAGVDETGTYNVGAGIQKWEFPSGATFFRIPGIGPIAVGGPLVSTIAQGQEANAAEADFSALGAGLRRCGIPTDNVPHYETAVKSNNYLVIVHCTPDEAAKARQVFMPLNVVDLAVHHA